MIDPILEGPGKRPASAISGGTDEAPLRSGAGPSSQAPGIQAQHHIQESEHDDIHGDGEVDLRWRPEWDDFFLPKEGDSA